MISTLSKKHNFDLVYDSQKVFRLLLEAISNPTRVVHIREYADKLFGEYPAFLAVAMTVLDTETSFHVCGKSGLAEDIASLTLAKAADVAEADFIFICDPDAIEPAIKHAKCGTLADPHKSATILVLNDIDSKRYALSLCGPGINGETTLMASPIVLEALAQRDAQQYEYPQGVDLMFLSNKGDLFAIPRTAVPRTAREAG